MKRAAARAARRSPPSSASGRRRRAPARECDGLIVCIPVAGPVGAGRAAARTPTYYQLACPGRGQVIGGLDADRAGPLELSFLGTLGGPVGPGVTTRRAAVFVARTTRGALGLPAAARLHPRRRRRRARAHVRGPTRQLRAVAPPSSRRRSGG